MRNNQRKVDKTVSTRYNPTTTQATSNGDLIGLRQWAYSVVPTEYKLIAWLGIHPQHGSLRIACGLQEKLIGRSTQSRRNMLLTEEA